MKKQVRTLMTLEEVGSNGKFFTDGVLMKCVAIFIGGAVMIMFIAGQLSYFIPPSISIPIGLVVTLPILSFLIQKFILRVKELCRIAEELEDNNVVSCNNYSDIYLIDKSNVCYHSSGYRSIFVSVDRLHTIDMSDADVEKFYSAFEKFESAILSPNVRFSMKMYEIEDVDKFRGAIEYQNSKIKSIEDQNVNKTTILRNKYLNNYINAYGVDSTIVYVIYCKNGRAGSFVRSIKNCMNNLSDPHLGNVHIMNQKEISAFGSVYFDVPFFNPINLGESIKKDLITFEEDRL